MLRRYWISRCRTIVSVVHSISPQVFIDGLIRKSPGLTTTDLFLPLCLSFFLSLFFSQSLSRRSSVVHNEDARVSLVTGSFLIPPVSLRFLSISLFPLRGPLDSSRADGLLRGFGRRRHRGKNDAALDRRVAEVCQTCPPTEWPCRSLGELNHVQFLERQTGTLSTMEERA